MMQSYFFQFIFDTVTCLTLSYAAFSPLTYMNLVISRGYFWKSLIIIKCIDLYVALIIIFKQIQEGLRKDFQSTS